MEAIRNFYNVSGPSFPLMGRPKDANEVPIPLMLDMQKIELNPRQNYKLYANGIKNQKATIVAMSIRIRMPKVNNEVQIGSMAMVHATPEPSTATQGIEKWEESYLEVGQGELVLPIEEEFYRTHDPENYMMFKRWDGSEASFDEHVEFSPCAVRVGDGTGLGFIVVGNAVEITIAVRYYAMWSPTTKIFPQQGGVADFKAFADFIRAGREEAVGQARWAMIQAKDVSDEMKLEKNAAQRAAFGAMAKHFMSKEAKDSRPTAIESSLDGFYFPYGLFRYPSRFWARNWQLVSAFDFAEGTYQRTGKKNALFKIFKEFADVQYATSRKDGKKKKSKWSKKSKAEQYMAQNKRERTKNMAAEMKQRILSGLQQHNRFATNLPQRQADYLPQRQTNFQPVRFQPRQQQFEQQQFEPLPPQQPMYPNFQPQRFQQQQQQQQQPPAEPMQRVPQFQEQPLMPPSPKPAPRGFTTFHAAPNPRTTGVVKTTMKDKTNYAKRNMPPPKTYKMPVDDEEAAFPRRNMTAEEREEWEEQQPGDDPWAEPGGRYKME